CSLWSHKPPFGSYEYYTRKITFVPFFLRKSIISALEEKQRLIEVINRDFNDKVKVYIGHELGCPDMANCSLVVSSYKRKKKPQGKVAVLGPVRMEYEHIIPALSYISDVLSDFLENLE
ncbi:MAG: hypothetical protein JXL82_02910, partial [Candidatus Omnitrophica bacterium]|nr:hypothetical protein [Candidatus Omnitrophota bacterium]